MVYNIQMNLTEKITIPSTVFAQIVDDEMVILDTNSENYFALDPIGTDMWQTLVNDNSVENLKKSMYEKYDVEEDVLEHDIEIFISKLLKNKLITLG
ncbi:PqqD family protein [Sulfurovum lithotrophicum]|nr:PqqD family protein [Sulfurovum lithotrophicum]